MGTARLTPAERHERIERLRERFPANGTWRTGYDRDMVFLLAQIDICDEALDRAQEEAGRLQGIIVEKARAPQLIVQMLRDCPEPIVHQMMLARVHEVGGRVGVHVADQIRAMLQVLANAIELGQHLKEPPDAV